MTFTGAGTCRINANQAADANYNAPAQVQLNFAVGAPPAVTTNPVDQTVNAGSSASFTVAASGTPTPTVQWQQSTDGGATFINIVGATSTTLTFATTRARTATSTARCSPTLAGTATTTAATLTVIGPPTVAARSAAVPYDTATAVDLTASITGVHTSIAVASAPAHGTTSIAGDVVTYTPTAGYFGADSFTYTATGPGGTSAPATVSVMVATPAAPTVAARSAAVPYDTATAVDLTASITGVHTSIAVAERSGARPPPASRAMW